MNDRIHSKPETLLRWVKVDFSTGEGSISIHNANFLLPLDRSSFIYFVFPLSALLPLRRKYNEKTGYSVETRLWICPKFRLYLVYICGPQRKIKNRMFLGAAQIQSLVSRIFQFKK